MKLNYLIPYTPNLYNNNQLGSSLGLGYLTSYLEKHIDEKFEFSLELDVKNVLKNKPDMIAILAYTMSFNTAVEIAKEIKKETDIPIVIGGNHITAIPQTLEKCFDAGVIGEGEETFKDLVQTYLENKKFLPENLAKIDGIVFHDNDKKIITNERKVIKNIDSLPIPRRDILHAHIPNTNEILMMSPCLYTSRGCPRSCPFCVNSKKHSSIRFHSPERIVEEISQIVQMFPEHKHINIYDELFVSSKKRLKAISELIISEKLHKKAHFYCMCKSEIFDEEIAEMLKRMNMVMISFGIESGDDNVLKYLKNNTGSVSENLRALNICDKYGIAAGGFFILASPPETKEALSNTYWFVRKNSPPMQYSSSFSLVAFPKTDIWDYAMKKGFVNEKKENWDFYTYNDVYKKVFLNEHYDVEFFHKAFLDYFTPLNEKSAKYAMELPKKEYERLYYEYIFNHLKDNIESKKDILEISSSFTMGLGDFFEDKKDLVKLDHWIYRNKKESKTIENEILKDRKFDLIFFNHSLEQIINPYEKISYFSENYLKPDGEIFLLIKNMQSPLNLISLLFNKWSNDRINFKKGDIFYNINYDKLLKFIEKTDLNIIDKYPIISNITNYQEIYHIFSLFQSQFDITNFLNNLKTESFLIHCKKKIIY